MLQPRSRWLLLAHALPARPSNLRVSTWRRLQALGAVSIKSAVWVLPDSAQAREDFDWVRTAIVEAKGEALVFKADDIAAYGSDEMVLAFQRARQPDYEAIEHEARAVLSARGGPARARRARQLEARLERLMAITHFPPENQQRAVAAVRRVLDELAPPRPPADTSDGLDSRAYQGRTWATRPRPGIDRMASAWLIRRFIDRRPRFVFADRAAGARQVTFDMYGAAFGHTADRCTFETLMARFRLTDAALDHVAAIVHDVDLKDGRFAAPEAHAFESLVEGLRRTHERDADLLDAGMALFEALYRGLGPGGAGARAPGRANRQSRKAGRRAGR
jgi:hypothetical protein